MSVWFGEALLLASVVSVAVASAALARDKIAFSSTRGGMPNADVYVMNADGSGQTRLTDNPADDARPAWSPGGTRIASISDRDGSFQMFSQRNGSSR